MEIFTRSSSSSHSSARSHKRKSGDLESVNDENVSNNSKSTVAGSKKLRSTEVMVTPSGKTPSFSTGSLAAKAVASKSALPRYNVPRKTVASVAVSTPTTVLASAPVATTPRGKGSARGAERPQTPSQKVKTSGADSAVQEALINLSLTAIKEKIETVFSNNNDKLSSIANGMKAKSKWDTKEKLKRQENAIKEFKEMIGSINEDLQAIIETTGEVDKKIVSVVTRTIQQHCEDTVTISALREKEEELQRVKEAIAGERGSFKTSLLQLQIQYDEKIHKLESSQMSQSKELASREKELGQLTTQLSTLKQEYDMAMKESSATAEQVKSTSFPLQAILMLTKHCCILHSAKSRWQQSMRASW
jgi:hypothetical protein